MANPRRERLVLIGLALGVGALIAYTLTLIERTRNPEIEPKPLSYSRHRLGAKGLARLLEVNGYTVRSHKRTFSKLPEDAKMLILFPPPLTLSGNSQEGLWTEEDTEALEQWVEEGGCLILMSGDSRIPETFRGEPPNWRLESFQATPERFQEVEPLWRPSWLQGIRTVRMGESRWGGALPSREGAWVPILGKAGKVKVALYPYGKGYVLECADWAWLTNEHLRTADNGAFILAVVRWMLPKGGVIYFDDAGQGDIILDEVPRQGFWAYAPPALRVAFLHLTILMVVVMVSLGRRFGLPLPSKPRAPALGDYVEALANLYASSKAAQPALETVVDTYRRKLCRRLGLSAGSTLLQVIQSLPEGAPLRSALIEAHQALQNPNLSEGEALRIIRRLSEAESPSA